jgi:MoxR-like ATPase
MLDSGDAKKIIQAVGEHLSGRPAEVELAVCTFLSGGHLLIEDVPGVGKTTLARVMAATMGGTFNRIQFTADLLPADITGVSILDESRQNFKFNKGPLFANFVLADEINRASPKTQSALLEAMSEGQVSVDGTTWRLPAPFMVIATQNAHDTYGTYPLPESQMDRFTMRIGLGYTEPEYEKEIIVNNSIEPHHPGLTPVLNTGETVSLKERINKVHFDNSILDFIMQIIHKTRNSRFILQGAGPRGGIALYHCAKTMAVLRGRDYVLTDDVKLLSVPVLAHRIILRNTAVSGAKSASERIIADIVDSVEVPL